MTTVLQIHHTWLPTSARVEHRSGAGTARSPSTVTLRGRTGAAAGR